MVGGERAGDNELREKRLRKKRAAERRLKKLAQVLAGVEGENKEELVLGVYDDIQEELRATIRKHKTKVIIYLIRFHGQTFLPKLLLDKREKWELGRNITKS